MKHKFTVIIDTKEEHESYVKGQLERWLELNCGETSLFSGYYTFFCYPDWNSIEVTN